MLSKRKNKDIITKEPQLLKLKYCEEEIDSCLRGFNDWFPVTGKLRDLLIKFIPAEVMRRIYRFAQIHDIDWNKEAKRRLKEWTVVKVRKVERNEYWERGIENVTIYRIEFDDGLVWEAYTTWIRIKELTDIERKIYEIS